MWFDEHSPQSRRFGLEALGVNRQHLGPSGGLINQFRTLPIFALVYLAEGEHEFESETTGVIQITAGQLFFLFPGVAHRYGTTAKQKAFSYWFVFDGALPREWMNQGLLNPASPVFDLKKNNAIGDRAEKAIQIAEAGGSDRVDQVSRLLLSLLHEVFSEGRNVRMEKKVHDSISLIIKTMNDSLSNPAFDLIQFCKKHHYSFEYARKAFKKTTGMSPNNYFTQLKLDKAKACLVNSEWTLSKIGQSLGIEDPYYFSRWFKKRNGVAPSVYRETYQAFSYGSASHASSS